MKATLRRSNPNCAGVTSPRPIPIRLCLNGLVPDGVARQNDKRVHPDRRHHCDLYHRIRSAVLTVPATMAVRSDQNKRSPLKAWMRALERTAAIDRDRTLTLPVLTGRLAPRRCLSLEATLTYRVLGGLRPLCTLEAGPRARVRRLRGADGELPGSHGHPAGTFRGRRHGGAHQHQPRGRAAGAFHQPGGPRYVITGASLGGALGEVRARLPAAVDCG
jgi:hypothetical protein